MNRRLSALIGAALVLGAGLPAHQAMAGAAVQAEARSEVNAPYNAFLSRYIVERDGIHLVRYGDVSEADHQALKDYVAALEGLSPSGMGRDEQLAYWFNLYNAKTIDIILDNYPVDSIRDIGGGLFTKGPWKDEVVTVEGRRMSLDNIEHDTVRAEFDEPRVHYAFNCASIGCPNLKTTAWEAATLDADLDAAARAYIAHPRGVSVEDGRVTVSSIYKWFKKDFGGNDRAVLDHIRQYATGAKAEALEGVSRINKDDYDWSLNEA
jgi:hypothetical protein